MATPKCANCGAPMIKILNVDKQRLGGGHIFWICGNIRNYARIKDAFDYSHLEIYCESVKPQAKKEAITVVNK